MKTTTSLNCKATTPALRLFQEYQTQFENLQRLINNIDEYLHLQNKVNNKKALTPQEARFLETHENGSNNKLSKYKGVNNHPIGLLQIIHPNITNYHMTKSFILLKIKTMLSSNDKLKLPKTEQETKPLVKSIIQSGIAQSLTQLGTQRPFTEFYTLFNKALSPKPNPCEKQLANAEYYLKKFQS
jgi:hypothetical protein